MGNCQAVDNASIVIQHPNGKVEKLCCPVSANDIMKLNKGHYVAQLLTTTVYSSSSAATANKSSTTAVNSSSSRKNTSTTPLRITRIKLLKPTDNLALGHVYRLVTTQEVMRGLREKKQARMKQQPDKYGKMMTDKDISDFEQLLIRTNDVVHNTSQVVKHERRRLSNNNSNSTGKAVNSSKSRGTWQPSLRSISESAT